MNKVLNIGIDIGSTTVKMVVMDKSKNVLFSAYERHYSDTKKTLIELFNKVLDKFNNNKFTLVFTGSGAISLSNYLEVDFVQEVIACKNAIIEYCVSKVSYGKFHDTVHFVGGNIFTVWGKKWEEYLGEYMFKDEEEAKQALTRNGGIDGSF